MIFDNNPLGTTDYFDTKITYIDDDGNTSHITIPYISPADNEMAVHSIATTLAISCKEEVNFSMSDFFDAQEATQRILDYETGRYNTVYTRQTRYSDRVIHAKIDIAKGNLVLDRRTSIAEFEDGSRVLVVVGMFYDNGEPVLSAENKDLPRFAETSLSVEEILNGDPADDIWYMGEKLRNLGQGSSIKGFYVGVEFGEGYNFDDIIDDEHNIVGDIDLKDATWIPAEDVAFLQVGSSQDDIDFMEEDSNLIIYDDMHANDGTWSLTRSDEVEEFGWGGPVEGSVHPVEALVYSSKYSN